MSCAASKSSAQRWRDRRQSLVDARAVFDPRDFAVDVIPDRLAKPFVVAHHYSGTYPASRLACGLFRQSKTGNTLAGVAVFSTPMNNRAVPKHLGMPANDGVDLGRLVLHDDVGLNGESWFLARCFRLVKSLKAISGVLSYSDPLPRHDQSGQLVMPGHVGIVYQALNAAYGGRATPRKLLVGKSGRVISERAIAKIRNGEQGRDYAIRQLLDEGAPVRCPGEDIGAWLRRASEAFRRIQHPGNHIYVWNFTRPGDGTKNYPKQNTLM